MSKKRMLIAFTTAIILGVAIAKLRFPHITSPNRVDSIASKKQSVDLLKKNDVIATVGDEKITLEDIEWESSLHTLVPKTGTEDLPLLPEEQSFKIPPTIMESVDGSDALKQRLLVTLIERKILYQWIKTYSDGFDHENPSRYLSCLSEFKEISEEAKDLVVKPGSKERLKTRLCESSLVDQYLHEKIYPAVQISEVEVSNFYKTHQDQFKEPARIVFRQILLPTEDAAKDMRPRVNRNNFAELAKSHSIAAEAANGGKVGPFSREQLPTFFDIVFNMQNGEISGILRSDYGFHIVMPLERLPATSLTLSEARRSIVKQLEDKKRQELYQNWLTTAMNAIPVRSTIGEENK